MKLRFRFWKNEPQTDKDYILGFVWSFLISINSIAVIWTLCELLKHFNQW